jgi:hypothetical protein
MVFFGWYPHDSGLCRQCNGLPDCLCGDELLARRWLEIRRLNKLYANGDTDWRNVLERWTLYRKCDVGLTPENTRKLLGEG